MPPSHRSFTVTLIVSLALFALVSTAPAADVIAGADISALPDIERDGGVFRDAGKPDDEIAILRRHGMTLFRVRLFVDPNPDPKKNWGATQSLPMVKALAKRIKAAGGTILLDLHYSDTWADPSHQQTPKAWQGLAFDALEKQVGDYTTNVMNELQSAGTPPDMVQVGNEITTGMLWPAGQVGGQHDTPEQWQHFARLLAAGVRAVHAAEQGGKKMPVVLHIDSGGRAGVPQWFFKKLAATGTAVDFDIIGLSFYPEWSGDLAALKQNMADLAATYHKYILLAEVGYPWGPIDMGKRTQRMMHWPQTPAGQADFLRDVQAAVVAVPGGHGIGYAWWYPDAIPVAGRSIYLDGNEALFDRAGNALPALDVPAKPQAN